MLFLFFEHFYLISRNFFCRFIKEAKDQNGKVLVHCKMGISRSATCVISFIMKEYGKDLSSALIHTKDRRSIVNPNKR